MCNFKQCVIPKATSAWVLNQKMYFKNSFLEDFFTTPWVDLNSAN